jgi:hypothetical protein
MKPSPPNPSGGSIPRSEKLTDDIFAARLVRPVPVAVIDLSIDDFRALIA